MYKLAASHDTDFWLIDELIDRIESCPNRTLHKVNDDQIATKPKFSTPLGGTTGGKAKFVRSLGYEKFDAYTIEFFYYTVLNRNKYDIDRHGVSIKAVYVGNDGTLFSLYCRQCYKNKCFCVYETQILGTFVTIITSHFGDYISSLRIESGD